VEQRKLGARCCFACTLQTRGRDTKRVVFNYAARLSCLGLQETKRPAVAAAMPGRRRYRRKGTCSEA
jgi:hypothetical protein